MTRSSANLRASKHPVTARLRALARESGPGGKMPTARELCRILDASVNTVDAALSELEAGGIISRLHGVGIYASERVMTRRISLVADAPASSQHSDNVFWSLLQGHLIQASRIRVQRGEWSFSLHLAPPAGGQTLGETLPPDVISLTRAGMIDGMMTICIDSPSVKWVHAQGIPTVGFACWANWTVTINYRELNERGRQLLEADGCRRISLWAHQWPPPSPTASRSEQGKLRASNLNLADCPDGLVFDDDAFAAAALTVLESRGVRIGKDLRIASHANAGSDVLAPWASRIHRLCINPAEIAGAMVSSLAEALEGRNPAADKVAALQVIPAGE